MKRTILGIALMMLFVTAGLHSADDPKTDPFLGTWKYNYAKSTHDEESATQMTRKHELAGDGMKFTRDAIDAHGKPQHSEYTIKFDGKAYRPSDGAPGPLQTFKRIDRYTIECHVKFDAEHSLKQVMVMAKDGKSYVLTETGQYANGKLSNHFSVFEKQ